MDHCRFKPEAGGFNKLNDGSVLYWLVVSTPTGKSTNQKWTSLNPPINGFFLWDHY
jgi:hypothetical protein